jgi:multiple sugar transport system permease protein
VSEPAAVLERERPAAGAARASRLGFLVDRPEWLGPLMLGPAVLYIVLVVGVPFVLALYYSVSDISMGSRTLGFVGLKNFISVVQTTKFQTSLKNTFIFAIGSQVVVMVLANVLALALLKEYRWRWWKAVKWGLRFLILLPWVAPISLGTIAYLWILDSTYSPINWTLEALGLVPEYGGFMWLGIPYLAMGSVIAIHAWRIVPLATVIILAGLTSIPHDIHDAAAMDGAGYWRHLFQVTLPLVRPIMLVAGLFGLVFAFTDMVVIFVLTRGGPYDTTQVLTTLAFFTGIQGGDLAEGAAVAVFLFPLLLAVAIGFLRIARRAEVT